MSNIEKYYAKVFSDASGKQVLSHLRSITVERVMGPNASNEDLRWWAAQSALVHRIEYLIKQGNNPT